MGLFRKAKTPTPRPIDPDLARADAALAGLNAEMAARLISLASKTGQIEPLIEAVEAMSKANALFTHSSITEDHVRIQKALGDTLLKIGRKENDRRALEASIPAYRGAITVASMLGSSQLRSSSKKNLALAHNLLGHDPVADISSPFAA
ncbi:hypothetical protein [Robiginitomaculum antarcticum]|uniref:hypothetical protein n=1 Tax=Robiginitomaculum antarcticum TaxID=437507 RepID=UPI0012EAE722|nr:hypothetical protein [Robiginitomaculum antarcticum]